MRWAVGRAHDADEHVTLIMHLMQQQLHARAHDGAPDHRIAQPVDRAQRLEAHTHHQPRAQGQPGRGDVGRVEAEVVVHTVGQRHQHVAINLDPGGSHAIVQRFEKCVRQQQVGAHPFLGARMGQVEVQPDKSIRNGRFRQPLQRLCTVHRHTSPVNAKPIAAN